MNMTKVRSETLNATVYMHYIITLHQLLLRLLLFLLHFESSTVLLDDVFFEFSDGGRHGQSRIHLEEDSLQER